MISQVEDLEKCLDVMVFERHIIFETVLGHVEKAIYSKTNLPVVLKFATALPVDHVYDSATAEFMTLTYLNKKKVPGITQVLDAFQTCDTIVMIFQDAGDDLFKYVEHHCYTPQKLKIAKSLPLVLVPQTIDNLTIDVSSASHHYHGLTKDVYVPLLYHLSKTLGVMETLGYSHGDISLENIAIDSSTGKITLLDFGLARKFDKKKKYHINIGEHTEFDGKHVGKRGYLSPRAIFRMPYNAYKNDMYSFGVLAFMLLSGYPPYYHNIKSPRAYAYMSGNVVEVARHCSVDIDKHFEVLSLISATATGETNRISVTTAHRFLEQMMKKMGSK